MYMYLVISFMHFVYSLYSLAVLHFTTRGEHHVLSRGPFVRWSVLAVAVAHSSMCQCTISFLQFRRQSGTSNQMWRSDSIVSRAWMWKTLNIWKYKSTWGHVEFVWPTTSPLKSLNKTSGGSRESFLWIRISRAEY